MKTKKRIICLSSIGLILLIVWFSCNPFLNGSKNPSMNLNVLDETDQIKATGALTIYVGPNGKPTAAGTSSDPMNLEEAIVQIAPGGTIWMLDGTYSFSYQITIERDNCGSANAYKKIFAVNPGKVTLDFSSQPYGKTSSVTNPRGMQINGHYWHVKGIKFYRSADNGLYIAGNYNIIENCVFQANRDSGLQLGRYASTVTSINEWPSYNQIINCESFDNYDEPPNEGENADGFACKLTTGYGNKFIGCIAHHNIDDGWDLYTKTETGPIGPVVLDRCIAYSNGTLTNGTVNPAGDKNGFKLGGEDIAVVHYVSRCVAFKNGKNGFTWNSNPGAIQVSNCLAWDNVEGNYKFDGPDKSQAIFYNNLSYWTQTNTDQSDRYGDVSGAPTGATNCFWYNAKLPYTWNDVGLQVSASDFVTNPASITTVPKNSDGSPNFNIFKLAAGSDLINAGIVPPNFTLPYTPSSYFIGNPDLGPVESY